MAVTMHYSVSAKDVLNHPDFGHSLKLMKEAGVTSVWLYGYFYGRHESDPETLARARQRLLNEGFETGVLSLPVGHPGNSLDPTNPDLELALPPEWRYRVCADGRTEYYCACVEPEMIRSNVNAAKVYAQIGFTRHFFDDDLRMGSWGDEVRGCFCDNCIRAFNEKTRLRLTRNDLAQACAGKTGMEEICAAWIRFNCEKITSFMRETRVPEMQSGIMVMHNGDEKHGISIPDIKQAVPDCMFRVGELHFDDTSFCSPVGQASLQNSVQKHLALIGDHPAFSESTVFPANALSPENLIRKLRLERKLGLKNIFLMSGTWFLSDPYWKALAQADDLWEE